MLANYRLGSGGHRDQFLIVAYATKSAPSVISSALRDALNGMLRDILKPISFIVRDVVSVLRSAGEKQ